MPKKDEYPEDGELVLGTVDSIFNQGAFVKLDEYVGKRGMLHVSEMSLKWVRNIRDYVKEGQKIVLQVLKTDPSRGHIDLSLRRVNDAQRKTKLQEVKKQQKAEKIIDRLAKEVDGEKEKLLSKINEIILPEYDNLYAGFEAISLDNPLADKLGLPKKARDALVEIINKSIKPSFVEITGYVELKNYGPHGIKTIKSGLAKTIKDGGANIEVSYVSAPVYRIKVKSDDYKKAEKALKEAAESCIQHNSKNQGEGAFYREMPK